MYSRCWWLLILQTSGPCCRDSWHTPKLYNELQNLKRVIRNNFDVHCRWKRSLRRGRETLDSGNSFTEVFILFWLYVNYRMLSSCVSAGTITYHLSPNPTVIIWLRNSSTVWFFWKRKKKSESFRTWIWCLVLTGPKCFNVFVFLWLGRSWSPALNKTKEKILVVMDQIIRDYQTWAVR